MNVGFIGLGSMGFPMVERLCASGHSVGFCARKTETIDAASACGAGFKSSVDALARESDVLILCVYSDEQVRELALAPGGISTTLKPGSTLIIHTTGSPQTARDIETMLSKRDSNVLDVPVSGGPHDIRAGAITLLAGGDAAVLENCRPVLSAYGNPILHTGPLGSGQAVKLVNNLLFGAQVDLVSEASRILAEMNIEPAAALRAIGYCSGDSKVLQMALRSGSIEALVKTAGRFIAKDRRVAGAVAAELGIDTGLLGVPPEGNDAG